MTCKSTKNEIHFRFHYEARQVLLQSGTTFLCNKMGNMLLQSGRYYKVGQLLLQSG